MDKILNYGDVVEIGRFFHKSNYDRLDIDMIVYVDSLETLKKVNEDFYYRNNAGEERQELPSDYAVDEVSVNISDTFKITYRVKEVEEETTTTTEIPETTTTTKKAKGTKTKTTTKKAGRKTSAKK